MLNNEQSKLRGERSKPQSEILTEGCTPALKKGEQREKTGTTKGRARTAREGKLQASPEKQKWWIHLNLHRDLTARVQPGGGNADSTVKAWWCDLTARQPGGAAQRAV
eukprot:scaffold91060_cov17-Tisochrysis_lutea.AAC.1